MPQLSLYLDEELHKELETRARLKETSVSKFVTVALKTHFSKGWPDGYRNVFGCITDESFVRPETPDWSFDIPREIL